MAKRADDPGNTSFPKSAERPQEPSEVARPEAPKNQPEAAHARPAEPRGGYTLILLIAIIVTCLGLIYYLATAHDKIDDVNLSLLKTRGELAATTGKVEESQDNIFRLNYDLSETRGETAEQKRQLENQSRELRQQQARYRQLSTGMRKLRAEYWRKLRAIEQEKADRKEMHQLEQDVKSLKTDTDALKQKVVQTDSPVSQNTVSQIAAPAPAAERSEVRMQQESAPEAENYGFQLQRQDGILWLLNVGLDLKKVKLSDTDARYDLEVRVDGAKIKKKDAHVNEPIFLEVEGTSQPYRLVVTRIEKDQVEGYLSVPRV